MCEFIYLHIPKTAGTSFRKMLYKQFEKDDIFPNEKFIKNNNGKYPDLKELRNKYIDIINEKKLLTGHLPYFTRTMFDNPTKVFTFFREPVSRTISFLYHCKNNREKYLNSKIEDIFNNEYAEASNLQVKLFSRGFKNPNKTQLEIACDNLLKLDCFGITEDFENSIILLEKTFGWNLGKMKKINITKTKEPLSEQLINRIIEANQMDSKLYSFAKSLYHNNLTKIR